MSKVDWSLAPEWADHVVRGPLSGRAYWASDDRRIAFEGDFDFCDDNHVKEGWDVVEEKPQPKPWSGPEDGLPPVNMECEVHDHSSGEWCKCIILAHDLENAVFRCTDHRYTFTYDGCISGSFRAIRTPEQLAAEEREMAAQDMWSSIEYVREKGVFSFLDLMRGLHDQGFKREVK